MGQPSKHAAAKAASKSPAPGEALDPAAQVEFSGPLHVAYRRHQGEWLATALEFDLVGYGPDRKAALRMLAGLVDDHVRGLAEMMRDGADVRFFNPSGVDEWNAPDLEHFTLRCSVPAARAADGARGRERVHAFVRLGGALRAPSDMSVELLPAYR